MESSSSATVAIQTAVFGTGSTGICYLFAKRFAGAVYPHCCIAYRDSGTRRKLIQTAFFQIHDLKRLAVILLQVLHQC